ncbi:MAG: glycosyltransferase family A protein [Pseudomonadota bacterium]
MTSVSIVFRALNEGKWFAQALQACRNQVLPSDFSVEIVLVDSGSTDNTISIAQEYECNVVHIDKSEFTFGRSLNLGCEHATGEILVFISAHCIPCDEHWLYNLIVPLADGTCEYTYGRQIGLHGVTRFSETQVFDHFYGPDNNLMQDGFFCNNANSAIVRSVWEKYKFDEKVTGLEDMVLAKAIVSEGGQIGYVASANVTHIHEESMQQTYKRYFREALTMREIMPEVHFGLIDFLRCFSSGVGHDLKRAARSHQLTAQFNGIFAYRFMQYWGTYRGHNEHRELSRAQKTTYYYPGASKKKRTRRAKRTVGDRNRISVEAKSPN